MKNDLIAADVNELLAIDDAVSGVLSKNSNEETAVNFEVITDMFFEPMIHMMWKLFSSFVKSEGMTRIKKTLDTYIKSSDLWDDISCKKEYQDVLLLAYSHAFYELINKHDDDVDRENQNKIWTRIIEKHKHMKDCVMILHENAHIKHAVLAKKLDMSAQSLTNFMNAVGIHRIFEQTRDKKNCYYSLSYPNGRRLLSYIRNENRGVKNIAPELLLKAINDYNRKQATDHQISLIKRLLDEKTETSSFFKDILIKLNHHRIPITQVSDITMRAKQVRIFTSDVANEVLLNKMLRRNDKPYEYIVCASRKIKTRQDVIDNIIPRFNCENAKNSLTQNMRVTVISKRDWNKQWIKFTLPDKDITKKFTEISLVIECDKTNAYVCEDMDVTSNSYCVQVNHDKCNFKA